MSEMDEYRTMVVIGAQKSGTATLSVDLSKCSHFEMDLVRKEESPLLGIGGGTLEDAKTLEKLKPTSKNRVYVDVSTLYTVNGYSVPVEKVVEKIPNLKIVYILREPLARAISHHRQEVLTGKEKLSANKALTVDSQYVRNSLYGQHLTRWAKFIQNENIKIIKFEDYIDNRLQIIRELCCFAGIPDSGSETIESKVAHNVTASRPRFHPFVHRVLASDAYHNLLRKKLSSEVRDRIKGVFSLPNSTKPDVIDKELEYQLKKIFEHDNQLLRSILPTAPAWPS